MKDVAICTAIKKGSNVDFLRQMIDSVLLQELPLRLRVCLDGEDGDIRQCLYEYQDRIVIDIYNTERIHGVAAARNILLASVEEEWLMWVDADDILPLGSVNTLLEAMKEGVHVSVG